MKNKSINESNHKEKQIIDLLPELIILLKPNG